MLGFVIFLGRKKDVTDKTRRFVKLAQFFCRVLGTSTGDNILRLLLVFERKIRIKIKGFKCQ